MAPATAAIESSWIGVEIWGWIFVESGVRREGGSEVGEGLSKDVKSTADEERCIRETID